MAKLEADSDLGSLPGPEISSMSREELDSRIQVAADYLVKPALWPEGSPFTSTFREGADRMREAAQEAGISEELLTYSYNYQWEGRTLTYRLSHIIYLETLRKEELAEADKLKHEFLLRFGRRIM